MEISRPDTSPNMTDPLLKVSDLELNFGGVTALSKVSLTVVPGELRCIIGPNGAGKSTLFNVLCGVIRAKSGSIVFEGKDITGRAPYYFARSGIARKFQAPSIFTNMSVYDNLDVAGGMNRDNCERHHANIEDCLKEINLADRADTLAAILSHGEKQWLEIGMAMMMRPKLLLLDEPTAGMTDDETQRTGNLVKLLQERTAVLVIEHDMEFVRSLGQPTMVMHQGAIIADGPFEKIEEDGRVRSVYLGEG